MRGSIGSRTAGPVRLLICTGGKLLHHLYHIHYIHHIAEGSQHFRLLGREIGGDLFQHIQGGREACGKFLAVQDIFLLLKILERVLQFNDFDKNPQCLL